MSKSTRKAPPPYGLTAQFWSKAKKLAATAEQLMWLAPERYHDYRKPRRDLSGLKAGDKFYARLLVSAKPRQKDDKSPLQLRVTDGAREARVAVFGATGLFKELTVNSLVHLTGSIDFWQGQLDIKNAQVVPKADQGRLIPEYLPGESGLNRLTLGTRIAELITAHADEAVAALEEEMGDTGPRICQRLKLEFPDFKALLFALHQPADEQQAQAAKSALEHLSAFQTLKTGLITSARKKDPASVIPVGPKDVERLAVALPFPLTGDQQRAATEIMTDLARQTPMHRILSGDVGSGKTASYLIPAVAAQQAGRQVVILMPNTPLAVQIINELQESYPDVPVHRMVAGDKPPRDLDHKPVIIGTTAILHWLAKQDPRPVIDFAIVDEQQKLGVEQKRALIGPTTHLLEATATAIPRSQAMVRYGIASISRIEEMPVQKTIHSHFIDHSDKARVFGELEEVVAKGYQIAVLYPLREEDVEEGEVARRGVEQVVDLWEQHFPGQVGWIHGGLGNDEKADMIARMKAGDYKVIITSSVIEVGITIPNLRAMLVVEADRYGASTLHQIRGRLARKGGEGTFYMLPSVPKAELKDTARERLALLERSNNGLEIAEADLQARGFGELARMGTVQTGFMEGWLPGIKVTPIAVRTVMERLDSEKKSIRRLVSAPAPF